MNFNKEHKSIFTSKMNKGFNKDLLESDIQVKAKKNPYIKIPEDSKNDSLRKSGNYKSN